MRHLPQVFRPCSTFPRPSKSLNADGTVSLGSLTARSDSLSNPRTHGPIWHGDQTVNFAVGHRQQLGRQRSVKVTATCSVTFSIGSSDHVPHLTNLPRKKLEALEDAET